MMRWKYETDEKGYITGWEGMNVQDISDEDRAYPELPPNIDIGSLKDIYGNFKYKLLSIGNPQDLIKYEIIETPQAPTDEQIRAVDAANKKKNILNGIGIDHDDEIALLNKAIEALINGESVPVEYIEYRKRVNALKEVPNG